MPPLGRKAAPVVHFGCAQLEFGPLQREEPGPYDTEYYQECLIGGKCSLVRWNGRIKNNEYPCLH